MNRLQIADIVEPATIPWTPQTVGWVILLVLVIGALGLIVWSWLRRREANRYRREALAAIDAPRALGTRGRLRGSARCGALHVSRCIRAV